MTTAEVLSVSHAEAAPSSRNGGIDALRAVLIALVILHHTALTYGGTGAWFYREIDPGQTASSQLLSLFCAVNQAWFMGMYFLISGAFTPGAVARHGASGFLKERLVRLGVPLLVFGFLIGPATVALAATATGHPFLATLRAVWTTAVFVPGPLWFAEALLLFSVLYVLWCGVAGPPLADRPFPSNRVLAVAAFATGAAAFAIRLVWPVGEAVLGLQFGYFASYLVLFAAGCAGAGAWWLERIPPAQARLWWRTTLVALVVFPLAVWAAAATGLSSGPPTGGFNLLAVVYAFWEPLVAWGTIMALLVSFQAWFPWLDAFWSAAARRSYLVYIIHPPVLVGIALVLRGLAAPALVKFALTGSLAVATSFLLAGLLLGISPVRRIV